MQKKPPPPHLPPNNLLLKALGREEYARLLPGLKLVDLPAGKVLYEAADNLLHAYFPLSGAVSLLAITETGSTIEIAMVGSEGIVGLPVILGITRTPYRVMVQIRGSAMRVRGPALVAEFSRGGQLHEILLRYSYTLLTQISQSAVCNQFHTVEQKLSRWLLVTRDRTQSNEFLLTQEFISHMLGIPRTNVTMRASELQQRGLIRYSRGRIIITDPRGLEDASCECYRTVKQETGDFLAA